MEYIKGSHLRKIAENLKRFADIRESAKPPRNLVVVQAAAGTVKVVAGAYYGTMIATVHATTEEWRAVVSARDLLRIMESVPTKSKVRFAKLSEDWSIGCSIVVEEQDQYDVLRVQKELPRFMLAPSILAESQGHVNFKSEQLKELGNLLSACANWRKGDGFTWFTFAGKIYTRKDEVKFASTDGTKWASIQLPGTYELFGSMMGEFIDAVRAIGDAKMEWWTEPYVTVQNEVFKCVGNYRMLETAHPMDFTHGALQNIDYKAVENRTVLAKKIREVAKLDKHTRFALQYEDGAIKVLPFEDAKHGWFAKAENVLKVLTAISAKQIGIGLRTGRGQPINVRIPEWTIELAPVELQPSK
jgi:hypothetical protein